MKVVCFGNSLTYGYLVNKGYIDFLRDYFPDTNFINFGIPGDTAYDGLMRIDYSVLKHNPDLTIIEFGVNDAFSGFSVNAFKNNLLSIIEKIKGIKILMIPHRLYYDTDQKIVKPYYETIKNVAIENNLSYIDVSKHKLGENELLSDMLHPNENGYKIYAKETRKILINYLFKK